MLVKYGTYNKRKHICENVWTFVEESWVTRRKAFKKLNKASTSMSRGVIRKERKRKINPHVRAMGEWMD